MKFIEAVKKFGCLVTLCTLVTIPCFAKHPKISGDLAVDGDDNTDVIIQFTTTPTEKHHQKVRAHGGTHKVDLADVIKGGLYSIPRRALEALANDPDVAYITPDRSLQGQLEFANPVVNAGIARQSGFTGTGVTIALIDSGLQGRPDLNYPVTPAVPTPASRILFNQSFLSGNTETGDDYGHGTHVAGILAGNGYQSLASGATQHFIGIAPNANLVNYRVLDANGAGTDSYVIAAIQKAVKDKATYNIRVINLSLGRPVYESYQKDPLCQAVENAWKAGIVVVVAAGNDGRNNSAGTNGYATIMAPGNDPYVITVGAMKDNSSISRGDDTIASYSSKGPTAIDHIVKPDLVAPGNRIISLVRGGSTVYLSSNVNLIPNS